MGWRALGHQAGELPPSPRSWENHLASAWGGGREPAGWDQDGLIHSTRLSVSPPGSIHYSQSCGKKSSPAPPQIRAAASEAVGVGRGAFSALVPGGGVSPVQSPGARDSGRWEAPGRTKPCLGSTSSHQGICLFLASFPGESGVALEVHAKQW